MRIQPRTIKPTCHFYRRVFTRHCRPCHCFCSLGEGEGVVLHPSLSMPGHSISCIPVEVSFACSSKSLRWSGPRADKRYSKANIAGGRRRSAEVPLVMEYSPSRPTHSDHRSAQPSSKPSEMAMLAATPAPPAGFHREYHWDASRFSSYSHQQMQTATSVSLPSIRHVRPPSQVFLVELLLTVASNSRTFSPRGQQHIPAHRTLLPVPQLPDM